MDIVGEPLVTVEADGRTAAVIRDGRGHAWITADLAKAWAGQPLDGEHPREEELDGLRVVGGLMPRGAARVDVTNILGTRVAGTVREGAWIAVIGVGERGSSAVCFRGPDGKVWRPPLPAGWTTEPITDANEPCPACDGTTWEQVTPDDDSRGRYQVGDEPWMPNPVAACARCGYESGGSWTFFGAAEPAPEPDAQTIARLKAESDARLQAAHRSHLARVTFPLFAIDGRPVRVTSGGTNDGVVLEHVLDFGWVRVESRSEDWHEPPAELAKAALERLLTDAAGTLPNRSDGGRRVWLGHRERIAQAMLAGAVRGTLTVLVDGAEKDLDICAAEGRWAAAGRVGKTNLIITGDHLPPGDRTLRLRTIADPTAVAVEPADAQAPGYAAAVEPRDPLDPALVAELVRDIEPIAGLADDLAALARPGLVPVRAAGPARVGQSRFGGRPDLPAGTPWPRSQTYGPMTFFAQFALPDLDPAVWPGPRTGLLSIFCEIDVECMNVEGDSGALVLHWPADADLVTHDPPDDLARELRLDEIPIETFVPRLTMPSASSGLAALGFGWDGDRDDEEEEGLDILQDDLRRAQDIAGAISAKVLGWGTSSQGGDEVEGISQFEDVQPWVLLAQHDLESPLITVAIPLDDLAAGRFDRVRAVAGFD